MRETPRGSVGQRRSQTGGQSTTSGGPWCGAVVLVVTGPLAPKDAARQQGPLRRACRRPAHGRHCRDEEAGPKRLRNTGDQGELRVTPPAFSPEDLVSCTQRRSGLGSCEDTRVSGERVPPSPLPPLGRWAPSSPRLQSPVLSAPAQSFQRAWGRGRSGRPRGDNFCSDRAGSRPCL